MDLLNDPNLVLIWPELLLALGAMALLMLGVFMGDGSNRVVTGLSVALLVVAMVIVVVGPQEGITFNGAFIVDAFSVTMKLLILLGSAAAIIMSVGYAREEKFDRFEYPILIVIAALGMLLMASANDLIGLYLGLELQALTLYVIAAINRDSLRSTEAGLKFFVLGALSSGMLLYGESLIYGFTGHTNFAGIAAAMEVERSLGVVFGIVFVLAGIAFKVSAVPFHMWTPDVYEGAPTPVTAFFAAAPKVAAMGLLVRVVYGAFEPAIAEWQQIVAFISVASMLLGAFAAIGQTNIKRLMAYSSIGHMGFALVGLAAGTEQGVSGVVTYLMIYMFTVLGAFAIILAMRRKAGTFEDISELAGLAKTNPAMAFVMTAFMFSLAGIPPLAGFWAKWFVFLAAVQAELYWLAIIGVLSSVVAAFYYLRLVKIMWFDEGEEPFLSMPIELKAVVSIAGVFTILYVVVAGPVAVVSAEAARTFF